MFKRGILTMKKKRKRDARGFHLSIVRRKKKIIASPLFFLFLFLFLSPFPPFILSSPSSPSSSSSFPNSPSPPPLVPFQTSYSTGARDDLDTSYEPLFFTSRALTHIFISCFPFPPPLIVQEPTPIRR